MLRKNVGLVLFSNNRVKKFIVLLCLLVCNNWLHCTDMSVVGKYLPRAVYPEDTLVHKPGSLFKEKLKEVLKGYDRSIPRHHITILQPIKTWCSTVADNPSIITLIQTYRNKFKGIVSTQWKLIEALVILADKSSRLHLLEARSYRGKPYISEHKDLAGTFYHFLKQLLHHNINIDEMLDVLEVLPSWHHFYGRGSGVGTTYIIDHIIINLSAYKKAKPILKTIYQQKFYDHYYSPTHFNFSSCCYFLSEDIYDFIYKLKMVNDSLLSSLTEVMIEVLRKVLPKIIVAIKRYGVSFNINEILSVFINNAESLCERKTLIVSSLEYLFKTTLSIPFTAQKIAPQKISPQKISLTTSFELTGLSFDKLLSFIISYTNPSLCSFLERISMLADRKLATKILRNLIFSVDSHHTSLQQYLQPAILYKLEAIKLLSDTNTASDELVNFILTTQTTISKEQILLLPQIFSIFAKKQVGSKIIRSARSRRTARQKAATHIPYLTKLLMLNSTELNRVLRCMQKGVNLDYAISFSKYENPECRIERFLVLKKQGILPLLSQHNREILDVYRGKISELKGDLIKYVLSGNLLPEDLTIFYRQMGVHSGPLVDELLISSQFNHHAWFLQLLRLSSTDIELLQPYKKSPIFHTLLNLILRSNISKCVVHGEFRDALYKRLDQMEDDWQRMLCLYLAPNERSDTIHMPVENWDKIQKAINYLGCIGRLSVDQMQNLIRFFAQNTYAEFTKMLTRLEGIFIKNPSRASRVFLRFICGGLTCSDIAVILQMTPTCDALIRLSSATNTLKRVSEARTYKEKQIACFVKETVVADTIAEGDLASKIHRTMLNVCYCANLTEKEYRAVYALLEEEETSIGLENFIKAVEKECNPDIRSDVVRVVAQIGLEFVEAKVIVENIEEQEWPKFMSKILKDNIGAVYQLSNLNQDTEVFLVQLCCFFKDRVYQEQLLEIVEPDNFSYIILMMLKLLCIRSCNIDQIQQIVSIFKDASPRQIEQLVDRIHYAMESYYSDQEVVAMDKEQAYQRKRECNQVFLNLCGLTQNVEEMLTMLGKKPEVLKVTFSSLRNPSFSQAMRSCLDIHKEMLMFIKLDCNLTKLHELQKLPNNWVKIKEVLYRLAGIKKNHYRTDVKLCKVFC